MSGWIARQFSEVIDLQGGSQPPKSEFISAPLPGYVRFLQIRDFKSDDHIVYIPVSKKNRLCTEQDILIGRYGASVGQILTGRAGAYNVALMKAQPRDDQLSVRYLYYFLLSPCFQDSLAKVKARSAQDGFSKEDVADFEVPVPSFAEQKRIVAILDEAFEGIAKATANAERNLANARELLAAIRQQRFSALLHAWPSTSLGEVCRFENGDRGANYPGKQHRVAEGVPFINAGHLTDVGIDFSEMDYISPERFSLLGNGKIKPNDVLFCLRGSLGKFACVNELDNGAIASSLVILRPLEKLSLAYLLEYLAGPLCAAMIEKYKGGAAQPNLGAKDLKKFEIPLPTDDIQRSTAEELSAFAALTRDVESAFRAKIECCVELRQSLLHKAFSGQLTGKEAIAA